MIEKIKAFILKVLSIVPNTLLGILGVIQAIIKFVKEVCTLAIDILSPVIPNVNLVVEWIREKINVIDSWVEKIKEFLLNFV